MPRISTDNYDTVASWNGSQDLFVVEQPDGTKVATPAMVKQYILNDMDEVPTQNSNKLVKSGGVFSTVDDIYSVMGQMGAKNLIPYPYYESDHTDSGITWTVNSDGSVTANGTATANSTFIFRHRKEQTKFVEKNTSYIFSGCPSGGSGSTYAMIFFVKNEDDSNVVSGAEYGDGRKIDMPNQDYYGIHAFARVFSGQTVSNLTFKPMLRLASDTDETYQPYAKTNRQLTEVMGDLSQTGLTGDSVADQLGTAKGQIADVTGALNVEELRVSDGSNTSLIGVKFNGIIFFAGPLLRVTTTANTWVDTNTTHNMILTRNLEVAIWSAATGDWSGFAKFGTDGSVKVYAKYSGNFIPNLLGTVKL